MSSLKAPSTMLLRTFLRPAASCCNTYQRRLGSTFMPRSKYAKVTGLDKLHRKQKKAIREERQLTIDKAAVMEVLPPSQLQLSTQSPDSAATSNPGRLPFTIGRTTTNNIPVYETSKSGGNKHITQIRRLSGDIDALAQSLRDVLNLPESYVTVKGKKVNTITINRLTNQVVVRGWRGAEVKKWAEGLGF